MDQSCYKCGQAIEDGKPFCPQCGAPQIRVTMPEAAVGLTPASDNALAAPHSDAAALPDTALAGNWSHDVKPCALAAAIALVLTFVGLNPFVAALGAGLLAVAFSRRSAAGTVSRPASGARLGAIGGLLFFGMSTIFETLAIIILHKGAELRGEMIDKIQQAATRYPASEVQPFLDFAKSNEGFAFLMVASVIFGLLAFILLGSLGGAFASRFMGRHHRP